jgi:diguanylate cyclase (GGDEF)-like protein
MPSPLPHSGEVAYLAYHDAVTGLANRAGLLRHLHTAVARAHADGSAVALLYLDLDDFKLVNDGLGHATGDEVLRLVADRLRPLVREGDVLARHGGDEFLIVLGDLPIGREDGRAEPERRAVAVCHRIAAALDEPLRVRGAELHLRASVGSSVYPFDAEDTETLLRHADTAMYEAKGMGGGFAVYRRDAAVDPLAHLSLAARLRRAIEAGELVVHYQPIFRLQQGEALGVEALVRWRQPDGSLVAPDRFVPLAERTGLIDALGDCVFETVCRQLAAWSRDGLNPRVGVNLSPRQLRRPDLPERLVERIEAHGLDAGRFVMELTESSWTVEASKTIPALDRLRAAGLRLALDDFGAGYSSLSRLRDLPVDVIKIDRAFLPGVPHDPQATAIVTAIMQLAEACGCDVVAEGIEDDEQLRFLVDSGCALGQGYLLARPGPPEQAEGLLRRALARDRRDNGR